MMDWFYLWLVQMYLTCCLLTGVLFYALGDADGSKDVEGFWGVCLSVAAFWPATIPFVLVWVFMRALRKDKEKR